MCDAYNSLADREIHLISVCLSVFVFKPLITKHDAWWFKSYNPWKSFIYVICIRCQHCASYMLTRDLKVTSCSFVAQILTKRSCCWHFIPQTWIWTCKFNTSSIQYRSNISYCNRYAVVESNQVRRVTFSLLRFSLLGVLCPQHCLFSILQHCLIKIIMT